MAVTFLVSLPLIQVTVFSLGLADCAVGAVVEVDVAPADELVAGTASCVNFTLMFFSLKVNPAAFIFNQPFFSATTFGTPFDLSTLCFDQRLPVQNW